MTIGKLQRFLPWHHIAIILLPWLVVLVAFHWMAATFPTFHGSDETLFHYPAIKRFFAELPYPNVHDYSSATGPLFHISFALAAKVVGLSLQSLRLVNIGLSLAAVFVFYRLVARTGTGAQAVLFTLLFGLSPYFFGASFLALTDNIAILFALLAVRSLYRSWESGDSRDWVALCVWICLATLTRQVYIWLAAGAALTLFPWGQTPRGVDLKPAALKAAGLIVACLPLAALVLVWGGLTPPSFQQEHVSSSTINPRSGIFGLALVGLYWVALFPDIVIGALRGLLNRGFLPLAILLTASAIVLVLVPTSAQEDGGIVWRMSRIGPELLGNGILFWILFPLGILFFLTALRAEDPISARTALLALLFLICNLPNAKIFQKYYDPLTVAFVILVEIRNPSPAPLAKISRPLLLVAFIVYPFISWWMVSLA